MTNLAVHQQDFAIKAAWTFTSSGHGKSLCDGLSAVVKSAARKYLPKQGPEAAFCSVKAFYQVTLQKISQIFCSTKPRIHSQQSNSRIDNIGNESTNEGTDVTTSHSTRSIEVRWFGEEELEETFRNALNTRWTKLATKDNELVTPNSTIYFSRHTPY
ncbi:unnamed protein product, partial [Rotaria sp. Silwood2]